MGTMRALVRHYNVKARWVKGPDVTTSDEGWEHYAARVELRYTTHDGVKRQMAVPWRMGMAHDPAEPDAADVLASLALDYSSGQMTFDEFCEEYQYDSDSRKVHAMWSQCQILGRRFERFCSDGNGNTEPFMDEIMEAEH